MSVVLEEIRRDTGEEKRGATMTLSAWVKRLGQYHIYDDEIGECLCGQVALGNNYARVIPEAEREKCDECWRRYDGLQEIK